MNKIWQFSTSDSWTLWSVCLWRLRASLPPQSHTSRPQETRHCWELQVAALKTRNFHTDYSPQSLCLPRQNSFFTKPQDCEPRGHVCAKCKKGTFSRPSGHWSADATRTGSSCPKRPNIKIGSAQQLHKWVRHGKNSVNSNEVSPVSQFNTHINQQHPNISIHIRHIGHILTYLDMACPALLGECQGSRGWTGQGWTNNAHILTFKIRWNWNMLRITNWILVIPGMPKVLWILWHFCFTWKISSNATALLLNLAKFTNHTIEMNQKCQTDTGFDSIAWEKKHQIKTFAKQWNCKSWMQKRTQIPVQLQTSSSIQIQVQGTAQVALAKLMFQYQSVCIATHNRSYKIVQNRCRWKSNIPVRTVWSVRLKWRCFCLRSILVVPCFCCNWTKKNLPEWKGVDQQSAIKSARTPHTFRIFFVGNGGKSKCH